MNKFDVDGIGRVSAIVSSIMLMAIWLNVWVLKTDAHESSTIQNFPRAEETPELVRAVEYDLPNDELHKAVWVDNIISKIKPEEKQAVAYFFSDYMYAINSHGKVLAPADSMPHQNLPIISGIDVQNVEPGMVIQNEKMHRALLFIENAATNKLITPLISEVKGLDNGELVIYLNWGHVVPVKMGSGNWADKLDRLQMYYQQLGNHDLTKSAKYLDLRIEDRIIVKKNV